MPTRRRSSKTKPCTSPATPTACLRSPPTTGAPCGINAWRKSARLVLGERVIALTGAGQAFGLEPGSGTVAWQARIPAGDFSDAVLVGGTVTVAAWPGGLFTFDATSGRLIQRMYVGGIASTLAHSVGGDTLAFINEDDRALSVAPALAVLRLRAPATRFFGPTHP